MISLIRLNYCIVLLYFIALLHYLLYRISTLTYYKYLYVTEEYFGQGTGETTELNTTNSRHWRLVSSCTYPQPVTSLHTSLPGWFEAFQSFTSRMLGLSQRVWSVYFVYGYERTVVRMWRRWSNDTHIQWRSAFNVTHFLPCGSKEQKMTVFTA